MTESFEFKEAALPNIKGSFCANVVNMGSYTWGAITCVRPFGINQVVNGPNDNMGYQLNASLYNSIYKDDCTTVQPPAYTVMYIIKIK